MSKKIIAIDIGSSKISCLVAKHNFEKDIKIIGSYVCKSSGISSGVIKSISLLEKSILLTIENIEKIIKDTVSKVSVNISGKDLDYLSVDVSTGISQRPINKKDLNRLLSSITINVVNAKILHIIPTSYTVDDIPGIKNPIGMICSSLKLTATVVYVNKSLYKNLLLAFENCNVSVEKVVADPYAAALGSLTDDESKMGTVLLDLGANISSIAFFKNSALQFIKSIPIGGANITNDISYAFDIDFNSAERLKILYGSATKFVSNVKEFVLVQSSENLKQVQKSEIFAVISPRVMETLEILKQQIMPLNPRSIVITGGASMLTGILEVSEQVFKTKIRHHIKREDSSPSAIGIISSVYTDDTVKNKKTTKTHFAGNNTVKKIINWIIDNF